MRERTNHGGGNGHGGDATTYLGRVGDMAGRGAITYGAVEEYGKGFVDDLGGCQLSLA